MMKVIDRNEVRTTPPDLLHWSSFTWTDTACTSISSRIFVEVVAAVIRRGSMRPCCPLSLLFVPLARQGCFSGLPLPSSMVVEAHLCEDIPV